MKKLIFVFALIPLFFTSASESQRNPIAPGPTPGSTEGVDVTWTNDMPQGCGSSVWECREGEFQGKRCIFKYCINSSGKTVDRDQDLQGIFCSPDT